MPNKELENSTMSYAFLKINSEMDRLGQQAQAAREREFQLFSALQLSPKARVLEAGCGPGFITGLLAAFFAQGNVTSIDLREDLLQLAKKRNADLKNVEFKKGDFCQLNEADESFDFIYCRLALSHVPDPVAALKEFRRVLKKGGTLCVTDVDDHSVIAQPEGETAHQLLAHAAQRQAEMGGDRYIGRKLLGLCNQAGFGDTKVQLHPFTVQGEDTMGLLPVYFEGRLAYLNPVEQKALERWTKNLNTALSQGTGFLSFLMFAAIARK
ncbi:methyltransferase domain-containing protein [bacterium]|nr:methyltransferase domain-containing protein [bacterium]